MNHTIHKYINMIIISMIIWIVQSTPTAITILIIPDSLILFSFLNLKL
uniref:Uncharacterized protein n=1 Tax=Lepeophtheirus salmonis TaxID=72036 RepID=A0A0K2V510_LEPSM